MIHALNFLQSSINRPSVVLTENELNSDRLLLITAELRVGLLNLVPLKWIHLAIPVKENTHYGDNKQGEEAT